MSHHSSENMQKAVVLVESGLNLRVAANRKHVNYMTLSRHVKKLENRTEEERESISFTPNYANRKMFSNGQEKGLKEYIITCSKMNYGLDTVECRKLAYEMAVFHKLKIPEISASGSTLPPAMVFPRKGYKPFMLKDAPIGILGLAQYTGWMTSELFVEVMKHFIKVTSSKDESYLARAVLNIAEDNGSAPTTGVAQMRLNETSQLNRDVRPAESAIDSSTKSLETQAGPSMNFASRQDFLECRVTLPKLIPSDDDKIESDHLSPSILTATIDQNKAKDHKLFLKDQLLEDHPNLMNFQVKHLTPIKDDQLVSSRACRSYPKAQPRLQSNKGRKKRRSCIATDIPIKNKFEEAALKRRKNQKLKKAANKRSSFRRL
ncbi:hypothetical protein ILUMI_00070 [Ignelater luminosus]|uniref:HTH psq-type domain-containing protein n=1 Tax=Ignelater luminosus TaxID=2038154 RepID=A0A8K0DHZ8_IGNLU|nr:hypothetical protein ILUMI_00070 [Ignelater luminosus]